MEGVRPTRVPIFIRIKMTAAQRLEKQFFLNFIRLVDEAWVRVQYKDEFATLFIVLGNDASEILADYSYKPNSELEGIIETVSSAFCEQWEDVPVPTVG